MKNTSWFEVDRKGLAALMERKEKSFVLFELAQNAWDEAGVTQVDIRFDFKGRNKALLTVTDDSPTGFAALTHAYTLFAESYKKKDAEKRGRFNLGEKLVLALCDSMEILTTVGGVRFDDDGRHTLRHSRAVGTSVQALLRCTPDEYGSVVKAVDQLIVPTGIKTTFNGKVLDTRQPFQTFPAKLLTELSTAADGVMRQVIRPTTIKLFVPRPGEKSMLYEMGIPVVETGDKYHYDIGQKVPLTMERDNVKPSFLDRVRVTVFNAVHPDLSTEDMNSEWATVSAAHVDCASEATKSYVDKKFGEKRVSYDPSDTEANHLAVSQGYTVVHGGMMSAGAWSNAKYAEAILPAGQVTPGPKVWSGQDNPDAPIFDDWIPEANWTPGMKQVANWAKRVANKVMHINIDVRFCATPHHLGAASYGPGGPLTFNKMRLGNDFFEHGIDEAVVDLVIHEFGHEYEANHLSENFYNALTRIGAKLYLLKEKL